jgi:hypothetical protein
LPLLQEIDGGTAHGVALLKAFTSYVHGMMVAVAGGKAAVSVYKTIKTVLDINAGPMVWLKDEFKDGIIGWIHAAGHYYAHELVVGAAGMDRIGCHSLLSKDQGGEYLYAQMKDCATAVHYYIVDVMMRWADPAYRNRPEKEQWVDWLELVEYFTLHPRTNQSTPNQTKDVAVQFIHLLTAEELALGFDPLIDALVARYAPLTLMPTALPFTRQTILHANGDTLLQGMNMRRVAEDAFVGLLPLPLGIPLRARRLVIPYVRHQITTCDPAHVNDTWYKAVFEHGWEQIQQPTVHRHELKYYEAQLSAKTQWAEGMQLRESLEHAYRSAIGTGP